MIKDKLKRYQDFIYEKLNVDKIDLTKFNSIQRVYIMIYESNSLINEYSTLADIIKNHYKIIQ